MTQTLHKWMGKASPYEQDGELGVEIETETLRPYDHPRFDNWTTHADGSLRNFGVEYVLRVPLDYKDIGAALTEFELKTRQIAFVPSVYTSVHVHFNQKNRTLQQVFNFIALYLLFEEPLGRYCGPDREGNLFCLKTSNSERNLLNITNLITHIDNGNRRGVASLNANNLKYAGLNIAPLRNFGSLEVRTHYGTTDINLIDRWIAMLHTGIYKKALTFNNPVEIINRFNQIGYEKFLIECFGDYAKYLSFSKKDFEKTLWYATCVAGAVTDWSSFGDEKKKQENFVVKKHRGSTVNVFHDDEDASNGRTQELNDYWSTMGEVTLVELNGDM
jgi:hypothetical protein